MPTARLRLSGTPVASVGKPLRVRQMPAEGDPPAALVSPPAALDSPFGFGSCVSPWEKQSCEQVGKPERPSGISCGDATRTQSPLSGDPFGFARCLRRETLPQHWSHLLQRCLTRYLCRETLIKYWLTPHASTRLTRARQWLPNALPHRNAVVPNK